MKTSLLFFSALCLSSHAALIFEDFSSNTLGNYTTPAGRTAFTYSSGPGVGGAAGHVVGASGGSVSVGMHNTSVGGFVGNSPITTSLYFRVTGSVGSDGFTLAGVALSTELLAFNNPTTGNSAVALELRRQADASQPAGWSAGQFGLRFRLNDGNTLYGPESLAMVVGNWYEMALTTSVTNFATGQLQVEGVLRDWGSDGLTGGGTLLSHGVGSYSSTMLANDTSLHAGMLGRSHETTTGTNAIDNFSVVPEPSSALLVGLTLPFLFRRRR